MEQLELQMTKQPGPHDVAIEAARRLAEQSGRPFHGALFVIRRSQPITRLERLLIAAVYLARTPVAVVPQKCATIDEWLRLHRVVSDTRHQ